MEPVYDRGYYEPLSKKAGEDIRESSLDFVVPEAVVVPKIEDSYSIPFAKPGNGPTGMPKPNFEEQSYDSKYDPKYS